MRNLYTTFQTSSGSKYLYDSITNKIFKISDTLYRYNDILFEALDCPDKLSAMSQSEEYKDILKEYFELAVYDKRGYIGKNTIKNIDYQFTAEQLKDKLDNSLRHLSLCISEQCNLRCEYCIYSGHYNYSRVHTQKSMSLETAQKALDFFHAHSSSSPKVIISFYGGEPFLEPDTIKDIINYAEKLFHDKARQYLITTNGTLLDSKAQDFIIANPNVYVNITLNGDRDFHDSYRHNADGKGSFDSIMENIRSLLEKSPETFRNRINFLCNYVFISDILTLRKFYEENELLEGKLPLSVMGVNPDDNDGFMEILEQSRREAGQEIQRAEVYDILTSKYIEELDQDNVFTRNLFDKSLYKLYKRPMERLETEAWFSGVCMPFVNRIFVNCDGSFNICEKASQIADFGSISTGLNIESIYGLLEDYRLANQDACKSCWAVRLCSACFIDSFTGEGLDESRRKEHCKRIQDGLRTQLELFCGIMEKDETLLERLDKYEFPEI